jgi:hypothetical protein
MSLKKYLLASGLSTALVLGACNDEETTEAEDESIDAKEETDDGNGETEGDVSYSGEYGEYNITGYSQVSIESEDAEEEAGPTELVLVEFEFTNRSDVPTAPSEAFGMDLAVRQLTEDSETTLDNFTPDIPEDHERSDEATAAGELIEPEETVTAVVGYGPVDTSLETVLQSRESPMDDEDADTMDETIELQSE